MVGESSFGARHRAGRRSRGSTGFVTIALLVALAASSLAVVLGASNPSGILDVLDGRTWLRNDDGLLLTNNASGKIDFKLQTRGAGGDVRVVQNGRRSVLLDTRAGTLGAIDLSRYRVVNPSKVGPEVDVVSVGTDVFVIHKTTGVIELRDALTNEKLASVKVDGDLTRGVVDDDDGTLYVADETNGSLRSITKSGDKLRITDSVAVAPRGHDLDVGLLNGAPVVLDVDAAKLVAVVDGDAHAPIGLPLQSGDKPQLARDTDGPVLPVAVNDSGSLVLVRGDEGKRIELPGAVGHELGEPVPYHDTIYVPDYTSGQVHLVDNDGAPLPSIDARSGPGTYDVFVNQGNLFINDPDGDATVIGPDGTAHPVDKGDPDIPTNADPPSDTPPPDITPQPTPTPTKPADTSTDGPAPVTIPPGAPGAPGSPRATTENAATTVSWAAADDHGAPITKYLVACTSSDGGPTGSADAGTASSVRVDGLKNGKTYTCAVHAENSAGKGPDATTTPFKPSADVPDTPAQPTATAGDQKITVAFTPLTADQMQGVDVGGYEVACSSSDGGALGSIKTSGAQSSADVPATNGSTYTCTVAAMRSDSIVGALSPESSAVVPFGTPSFSSSGASASGAFSAHVSFDIVANGTSPGQISCDLSGPGAISGGCGGYDVSGLPTANTTYSWTITVTGPSGTNSSGPLSATTSFKPLTADATPAFGVCTAPNTPSYCGAGSSSQAGTSFPGPGIGTPVAAGTVLLAACWTTGDNINAPASGTNDNRWINIPSQGGKPWMSVLYFNPSGDSAIAGLPHC